MKAIRWITSGLFTALLLSACTGPSIPPGAGDGAGAPAEKPAADGLKQGADNSPSEKWQLAFEDSFVGSQPQQDWVPYPFFNQDNLSGGTDTTSPAGHEGVGVLNNNNAGGFATLSYVDAEPLSDFRLETWVYTTVTAEERVPLNGIAFRVDPSENRFYRFASHFVAEPSLSLAYVGSDERNFPVSIGTWNGDEIPGGPPAASGWHHVVVEVVDDMAEVYWDSQKLPGGPFALERIPSGFIGVYGAVTGGMGLSETKVADLKVFRPNP